MKKFDGAFLDLSGYEIFFEDDFNYGTETEMDYDPNLNPNGKWYRHAPYNLNFGWGNERFLESKVTLETSASGSKFVRLTATKIPTELPTQTQPRQIDYESGMIRTAPLSYLDPNPLSAASQPEFATGFKYGVFEIRAKMPPAAHGVWATVWLYGSNVEIDFVDGIKPRQLWPLPDIGQVILAQPIVWDRHPDRTTQWEDLGPLTTYVLTNPKPPDYNPSYYYYKDELVAFYSTVGHVRVYRAKEFVRRTTYGNEPGLEAKTLENQFNTYTVVWTPTEIAFFINGYKMYSQTTAFTEILEGATLPSTQNDQGVCSLYLNLQMNSWADVQTTQMDIEYVRIYKPIGYTPPPDPDQQNLDLYNVRFHTKTTLFNSLASLKDAIHPFLIVKAASDLIIRHDGRKAYHRSVENRLNNFYFEDPVPTDSVAGETWNYASLNFSVTNVMGNVVHHPTEEQLFYKGNTIANNNNPKCSVYSFHYDPSDMHAAPGGWVNKNLDSSANGPFIKEVDSDILVSPVDGKQVYYRDDSGRIFYFETNTPTPPWSSWDHYPTTPVSVVKDSLIHSPSISKKLYYRGMDNHLWNLFFDGTVWKAQTLDPLYTINNVAGELVHSPFSETIYYLGVTDSKIYFFYFDGVTWKHDCLHNIAGVQGDAQGYLVHSPTTQQLFYRDFDGHLCNFYLEAGVWKHGCLNTDITNVAENRFCVAASGDRIFYKGTDGRLHLFYFLDDSNGHGRWYTRSMQHEGSDNVANDIAVSSVSGKPFYIGTDGGIWNYFEKRSGNYDIAGEDISID